MSTKNSFNTHYCDRSGMTKRKFTKDFKRHKEDKHLEEKFWKRARNIRFHKQSREDTYGGDLMLEEPPQEQVLSPHGDDLEFERHHDQETVDIWDKMAALCQSQIELEQSKKRLAEIWEWHDEPCSKRLHTKHSSFALPMTKDPLTDITFVCCETRATKEAVEALVDEVDDKLHSFKGKVTFFEGIYLWKCEFYEPGTVQVQPHPNSFEVRLMTDIQENMEIAFYRTSNWRDSDECLGNEEFYTNLIDTFAK